MSRLYAGEIICKPKTEWWIIMRYSSQDVDMKEWHLSQARNKFSEVINAAMAGEPQLVTRRGKRAVVVMAAEEYERLRSMDKANAPSFVDLLLAVPQGGEDFERMALAPRPVDLCRAEESGNS